MTGLIDFSLDAASNDVAAPPILWAEGQPANTVNNSARALMAALACWRSDNTGALIATRSPGDVYAVSTYQIFSATTAAKAHTLAFTVDVENQGPASLAPDGQMVRPILRRLGRQLGPGDLTTGVVYTVRYVPAASAYVVVSPAIERPGRIALQADSAMDPGWVPCDGRLLSRVSYAALFAVVGTAYGAGDGATTFAAPDLRGRAAFGVDGGANRLTGAGGLAGAIGSAGGAEAVSLTADQLASHSHTGATAAGGAQAAATTGAAGAHDHGGATGAAGGHNHIGTTGNAGGHSHTGATDNGGAHTHPITHYVQAGYQGGSGGAAYAVRDIFPAGSGNVGQTDSGGVHGHNFTTNAVGDHQHGFTTGSVADHAHAIPGASDHTHAIPAVAAHTHGLSIDATGSGAAHPNMPPGLVVAFAIKA